MVLPAAFPNLLANGASGIAVGMATNIPPHNIGELIAACLRLIEAPDTGNEALVDIIPGPDFPTGGVIVEPVDGIVENYRTGRGAFCLRARWTREDLARGAWHIVVSELPYQVHKSRLIARIADLIQARRVPALADVRDESAEDIRIVLEPRSRNVDAEGLMETLFRVSDLEIRFGLNMNVLVDGLTPKVCGLRDVLRIFLDHQRTVLVRRTRHRRNRIDRRLDVLDGLILAFVNLDRVIDIVRYDDAPKAALMYEDWGAAFAKASDAAAYVSPLPTARAPGLSDTQAEAILNMRLRALRRLEEQALLKERDMLLEERAAIDDLLATPAVQWKTIARQLRQIGTAFGNTATGGARRTAFAQVPRAPDRRVDGATTPGEPITVVCSAMGWVRALAGHIDLAHPLKFKDGDGPGFMVHAATSDKLLVCGSTGRFYTLHAGALPGGRGMGEPLRLMIDLAQDARIVDILVHDPGRRLLLATSAGDGFVVPEADVVAQTRAGKQIVRLGDGVRTVVCRPVEGDHVAVVGDNRKLLVFAVDALPEMRRGKGVRLQRYKDGGLADARTFTGAQGLSWHDPAGRRRTQKDVRAWIGQRATAGRMAPRGFPRDNRFT